MEKVNRNEGQGEREVLTLMEMRVLSVKWEGEEEHRILASLG